MDERLGFRVERRSGDLGSGMSERGFGGFIFVL